MEQRDNAPVCPDWVENLGKRFWSKVAPQLHRDGILNAKTADLFASACQAYAVYRHAVQVLKEEGRVITTNSGTVKTHPMMSVEKQAFEMLCRVFKELGIANKPVVEVADALEAFN